MKTLVSIATFFATAWGLLAINSVASETPATGQTLTGEKAVAALKNRDQYHSLQAAFEAARYRVGQRSGSGHAANNPAQGLRTRFAEAGPTVHQTGTGARCQTALKLVGWGYGENTTSVPAGEIHADGNRVEYRRGNLTEWYINDRRGIEQGFTLDAPPADNPTQARLVLAMTVEGDLTPALDGEEIVFNDSAGERRLRYSKLASWDARGRALASRMRVRERQVILEVDDHGAIYPITVDPLIEREKKLISSDGEVDDLFGSSVAIDGDTAVVGAPGDDNANIIEDFDSGSAYVFVRDSVGWSFQAKLTDSDEGEEGVFDDRFGSSVAISGNTIVVGVPSDDNPNAEISDSGSAFVFVRGVAGWEEQAKLTAEDPDFSEGFGIAVAISGDTVAVGTTGQEGSGSVFVFVRSGTTWIPQDELDTGGPDGDLFAHSVAISGDTLVAGAAGQSVLVAPQGPAITCGVAYVFVRVGTVWSNPKGILANDRANGDRFGTSVAVRDDTIVIGAPGDENPPNGNTFDSGSAYVFTRSGTDWSQQQKLVAGDLFGKDFFGEAVALDGDTAVIGAPGEANAPGKSYVFVRDGTVWTEQEKLTASDASSGMRFGRSVAISGHIALVGAPGEEEVIPLEPFAAVAAITSVVAYAYNVDITPPTIVSVKATPKKLTPVNHAMVPVTVTVTATDNYDGPLTCRIVSVTSSEPREGTGPGDLAPDWNFSEDPVGFAGSSADLALELRAERAVKGSGRIYTIKVECKDESGNTSTSTVKVKADDEKAPVITKVTTNPSVLWPPYHQMMPVTVRVKASDASGGPVTSRIVKITSNEPLTGTAVGDCAPDWKVTGKLTAQLRAERATKGTGRIYTITVETKDEFGNSATRKVTVRVPKNLPK